MSRIPGADSLSAGLGSATATRLSEVGLVLGAHKGNRCGLGLIYEALRTRAGNKVPIHILHFSASPPTTDTADLRLPEPAAAEVKRLFSVHDSIEALRKRPGGWRTRRGDKGNLEAGCILTAADPRMAGRDRAGHRKIAPDFPEPRMRIRRGLGENPGKMEKISGKSPRATPPVFLRDAKCDDHSITHRLISSASEPSSSPVLAAAQGGAHACWASRVSTRQILHQRSLAPSALAGVSG